MSKAMGKAITMDGPFAETKELVVGYWPARAGRYASVNGLRMYYEVHGRGRPLVMLHSGLGNIESSFSKVMPLFAGSRRVIAIEQQAHGRTADIDRSLSHEQMADDTAELLSQLEIEQADFVGYSMGGAVALQLAVRHPALARKLAIVSGGYYNTEGYEPDTLDMIQRLGPNDPHWPADVTQGFQRFASAERWPAAVKRFHQVFSSFRGVRQAHLRSIRAHTLLVTGDQDPMIRVEHTNQLARLLPHAELQVIPGAGHEISVLTRSAPGIPAFLDAPAPRC
jgi:pimeloyl-ACP methyl ester carboxylesterase